MTPYVDRKDAGQQLAQALKAYHTQDNTIVLALPRGGVPVAFEISQALELPLDVLVVRKLGVIGYDELAMGAIALNDICVKNPSIITAYRILDEDFKQVQATQKAELMRRHQR